MLCLAVLPDNSPLCIERTNAIQLRCRIGSKPCILLQIRVSLVAQTNNQWIPMRQHVPNIHVEICLGHICMYLGFCSHNWTKEVNESFVYCFTLSGTWFVNHVSRFMWTNTVEISLSFYDDWAKMKWWMLPIDLGNWRAPL